jgi:nitrite reductase/ring-hydroxylating ferredoxin subunit
MSQESTTYRPFRVNRRQLLRLAGASAGALLLGASMASCSSKSSSGASDALNVADLPVGSLRLLSSDLAVGRDAQGFYAMTSVCTHEGCSLEDSAQTIAAGLRCPCHGSTFDGNGKVTKGPAREDLQHYQVTIGTDGSITVDTSKSVAASVRTPVG